MSAAVHTWHICVAGFTQRLGEPSGMHSLWLELGSRFRDSTTAVEFREWNSRWRDLAELIKVTRNRRPPTVCVYAYSWGAGWGLVQFAEQLRQRGIKIEHAVLSDPVYRSRWISASWRSLIGCPRVVVPPNVGQVWVYWQHRPLLERIEIAVRNRSLADLPVGHRVVAGKWTVASWTRVYGVTHSSMDEDGRFVARCLEMAGRVHKLKVCQS